MPCAKKLREEMVPLAKRINELREAVESDDGWTAEQREEWDRVNEEYDSRRTQAEEIERVQAAAARVNEDLARASDEGRNIPGREDRTGNPGGDPEHPSERDRATALQAWCRQQLDMDLETRHREACERVGFNPARGALRIARADDHRLSDLQGHFRNSHPSIAHQRAMEKRSNLSSQFGADGGYVTVPESFVNALEINMLAFGGMLQVSEIMTTATGERMGWPTVDDTSNTGEQVYENQNVDNSGAGGPNPSFAMTFWEAYDFSSKMILVPDQLLRDQAVNLPAVLGQMIGERLGRVLNSKYTNGTGAATPYGIVNRATLGKTAASATAITADELLELVHQIDPAYRTMGCRWMFHDSILLALRKLKDGEGRYLWQSGVATGSPDMLWGYPITNNQDMASSITASAKTALFGQLSKYKIRRAGGLEVRRVNELYSAKRQTGFIGFTREDGNLLDAGTAPVKYLQQASS